MGDVAPSPLLPSLRRARRLGLAGYLLLTALPLISAAHPILAGATPVLFLATILVGPTLLCAGWLMGRPGSVPWDPEISDEAWQLAVIRRTTAAISPAFRAALIYAVAGIATLVALADSPIRGHALPIAAALALVSWALAAVTLGPAVLVGVDGLGVGFLGRNQIIRWEEVESAGIEGQGLRVRLRTGDSVWLGGANGDAGPNAARLLRRIEEARSRSAAEAPRALPTGRGGRSVTAWREAMVAIAAGAGYRDGAIGAEALTDALIGGRATADERVGAALALVALDRARHGEDVRIAAAFVADDRVRVVLEQVADDALDVRALEALAKASRASG